MANVKENLRKKINRIHQVASQTVGRAEKTQVLNEVQHLELRIDRMTGALQHTKAKLTECLRTRCKEESIEKRKRKTEENSLVQSLYQDAKELENSPETGLLGSVMASYGQASDEVLNELVQMDLDVEKRVLERLAKFTEDEKNIAHLREKLKKAVLDMDSAKRRFQAHVQNGERTDQVQEELDNTQAKVENCKDNLVTDMYILAGKELIEIQMEYHRTAAKAFENILPGITKNIAMYPRRPVFGCPLEDHLRYSNREIAIVLEVCCCSLYDLGLKEEGLFRISGNATKVRKLKAGFDAGEIDLTDYDKDPHSIAGALKSYLRELPEPLMTHNLFNEWMRAGRAEGEQRIEAVQDCLSMLPKANFVNLRYLVKFLANMVENESHTKMSSSNLAIVMGPNMVWSPADGDNFLGSRLVECLVTNANYFFPGEINFTSNLIYSLHDRDGGFTEVNYPVTAASLQRDSRRLPQEKSAQIQISGGSPAPGVQKAHQQMLPVVQKRPKAPAPPPPPMTRSLHQLPKLPLDTSDIDLNISETPSKSSSLNDSLNEYGSDGEQEFYASVPPEDPQSMDSVGGSSTQQPYCSAEELEDVSGTSKTHRKTNSLDRPIKPARSGISPLGKRNNQPGKFPNESDLNMMLSSANSSSITGEETVTSVSRYHSCPQRPPLPTKEKLEKNSAFRSSLRKSEEISDVKEPVPQPRQSLQAQSDPAPKPHSVSVRGQAAESFSSDSGIGVTNVVINGDEKNSPESPKQKPPLPAKPKQMESESWSMTRL